MLIHSASQLLTLAGGPQNGDRLGKLGIIEDGAVLIQGEQILVVDTTGNLLSSYPHEDRLDAKGCVVMPGLIDSHTHLIWAGDRAAEFEMRLQGRSYLEILRAGGGILNTVKATRSASEQTLLSETKARMDTLFRNGTTTAEVKTGYGLNTASELWLLKAILQLSSTGPMQLVPTFLGAHAVPVEFRVDKKIDTDGYTQLICTEMLPTIRQWWENNAKTLPLPFVDVFCEEDVFNLEQSSQIFSTAHKLGFPLKIHADEFKSIGGVQLAVEMGAVSADHLVQTSTAELASLAKCDTVAVLLPTTPFSLGESHQAAAREMIKAGCTIAIASDINPGTAWCESMQFVVALACRTLHLTPAEAIAATTINAAAAIRKQDNLGSIETGKQADLLILNTPDYRHLAYRFGGNLVRNVIKKGKLYSFDIPE